MDTQNNYGNYGQYNQYGQYQQYPNMNQNIGYGAQNPYGQQENMNHPGYGGNQPPSYMGAPTNNYGYGQYDTTDYYKDKDKHKDHKNKKDDNYNDSYNIGTVDPYSLSADLDRGIRHAFIRKVFTILSIALAISFGFAACVALVPSLKSAMIDLYVPFLIIGIILYMVPSLMLVCSDSLATKVPINYILLGLMVIGISLLLGTLGAISSPFAFFMALGTTFLVSISLIIFASQVKYDFTGWGPYLMIFFLVFFVIVLIGIFVRQPLFHVIISGIGALLVSFGIVIDTQMIVGGKHRRYQLSIDQYMTAVVILYLDIVALFMYLLSIFNIISNN